MQDPDRSAALELPGIELLSELGRGGSSSVFRARRGGRLCAVKVARTQDSDSRWFRKEAAALARTRHPGLPMVLEVGTVDGSDEGTPYLVMELVEGETLAARLRRGAMSETAVTGLAIELASILDAVHQRGLVHRDVKPRNIVIQSSGAVRLVDFGLATFEHRPREVAGTRAYAAPEQMRVPVVVDGRTDLFALGCVLRDCLAGRSPATDHEVDAGSPWRVVLDGLIRTHKGDRYASASSLRSDLLRMQQGLPPRGPSVDHGWSPDGFPLVGREEELLRLERAWPANGEGAHRTVRVVGPSGYGKSRLMREFADRVRRAGGCVVAMRVDVSDPRPLAQLRELLDRVNECLDLEGVDPAEALRVLGPELASVVGSVSARFGAWLGASVHAEPVRDAEVLAELLAEVLARACSMLTPALVWVDDAHAVDAVTLATLRAFRDSIAGTPTLLALSERPGAASWGRASETVILSELSQSAATAFVSVYLGAPADPLVADWVVTMGGNTPLGLLEVLDALIDAGALVPHDGRWRFDRARAEVIHLPGSVEGMVVRRLTALPDATRRALAVAAVYGPRFETDLIAAALGISVDDLGFALALARRGGVIEPWARTSYRFLHDSMREALLDELDPSDRRYYNQQLAEALAAEEPAQIYRVAQHFADGEIALDPARVMRALEDAAVSALRENDVEAVIGFHAKAEPIAQQYGLTPSTRFGVAVAEAELRLGHHADCIPRFRGALSASTDAIERAHLLGRIAWAYQLKPDPQAAWDTLDKAFSALGETIPDGGLSAGVRGVGTLAGARLRGARRREADTRRLALLCELHYQNARLGMEYGQPLRFFQGVIVGRELAAQSGTPGPMAKTGAFYGVMQALAGQRGASRITLEGARAKARDTRDPSVQAYCEQIAGLAACYAGDFDEALSIIGTLIEERGVWIGVPEFCNNIGNIRLIESLRGQDRRALEWVERGVRRLERASKATEAATLMAYCVRCANAVLTLDAPVPESSAIDGFLRTATWGPRVRYFVERADFGEGFAAVLRDFEHEQINARSAHPVVVEYYIAIVQARVHQWLRAEGVGRRRRLAQLDRALADLSKMARLDLFKAHLRAGEAWRAFFEGSHEQARKKLVEAGRLADKESCVRVRYDIERLHAHLLTAEGLTTAAETHARLAAHIAHQQGAIHWQRWIHEETGVQVMHAHSSTHTATTVAHSSSTLTTQRRQLGVLMRMLRTGTAESGPEAQARVVVDELLSMMGGTRAFLAMEDDGSLRTGLVIGRGAGGRPWSVSEGRAKQLVRKARDGGIDARVAPWDGAAARGITLPLWLHEEVVGVFYLERELDRIEIPTADLELLVALTYQIPVALELARTLRERDRLQALFRQAQKMEAVGRFAGGMAHDFNNMLTIMSGSLELLRHERTLDPEIVRELQVVQDAVSRAADLSQQLLTFSRTSRRPEGSDTHDLNPVLAGCTALLSRLTRNAVKVSLELADEPMIARIDRGLFEQAIVNLVQNAADAMPDGGSVVLSTSRQTFDETGASRFLDLSPGPHVRVRVADHGGGIAEEDLPKIFDPFFTTKGEGAGTGLGLSMVYGFVKQHHGAIDVITRVGEGTAFDLYFPITAAEAVTAARPREPLESGEHPRPTRTILVVEDEDHVRRLLSRVLSNTGYHVLSARDAEEALGIASHLRGDIHLVITDVFMPGMTGLELARQITAVSPATKMLFISGHSSLELGSLFPDASTLRPFIQKPVDPGAVRTRVHEILTS